MPSQPLPLWLCLLCIHPLLAASGPTAEDLRDSIRHLSSMEFAAARLIDHQSAHRAADCMDLVLSDGVMPERPVLPRGMQDGDIPEATQFFDLYLPGFEIIEFESLADVRFLLLAMMALTRDELNFVEGGTSSTRYKPNVRPADNVQSFTNYPQTYWPDPSPLDLRFTVRHDRVWIGSTLLLNDPRVPEVYRKFGMRQMQRVRDSRFPLHANLCRFFRTLDRTFTAGDHLGAFVE